MYSKAIEHMKLWYDLISVYVLQQKNTDFASTGVRVNGRRQYRNPVDISDIEGNLFICDLF